MAPLVRDHVRPLERQQALIGERLEKKWIGHAVDRDASEIKIDHRSFRPAGGRPPRHAEIVLNSRERRMEHRELFRVLREPVG